MSDAVPSDGADGTPAGSPIDVQAIGLRPPEGERGISLDLIRWSAAMRNLRRALGIDDD